MLLPIYICIWKTMISILILPMFIQQQMHQCNVLITKKAHTKIGALNVRNVAHVFHCSMLVDLRSFILFSAALAAIFSKKGTLFGMLVLSPFVPLQWRT